MLTADRYCSCSPTTTGQELAALLSAQYKEKSSLLRDTFNELFDRKVRRGMAGGVTASGSKLT